jgi:hypothetical protein
MGEGSVITANGSAISTVGGYVFNEFYMDKKLEQFYFLTTKYKKNGTTKNY